MASTPALIGPQIMRRGGKGLARIRRLALSTKASGERTTHHPLAFDCFISSRKVNFHRLREINERPFPTIIRDPWDRVRNARARALRTRSNLWELLNNASRSLSLARTQWVDE